MTVEINSILNRNCSPVEKTKDLFLIPIHSTSAPITNLAYSRGRLTGQEMVANNLISAGLFLVQIVSSIVAVPFQLLAGLFFSLWNFAKCDFSEGFNELRRGINTSIMHFAVIPIAVIGTIAMIGQAILGLPNICKN